MTLKPNEIYLKKSSSVTLLKVYVAKRIDNFENDIEGVFSSIELAKDFLNAKAEQHEHYRSIKAEIIPFIVDGKSDLEQYTDGIKNDKVIDGNYLQEFIRAVDRYGNIEHATIWEYKGEDKWQNHITPAKTAKTY